MIPSGRRLVASSYIRNLSLWAPISKDMQIFKSKDSSRIHLTLDFRWEQLPGTWIILYTGMPHARASAYLVAVPGENYENIFLSLRFCCRSGRARGNIYPLLDVR